MLFLIAALLRLLLLLYGSWQDAHSTMKYTDIDYLVFTDASRAVSLGGSPYDRETYRYTPLLSWLLFPTTSFFPLGKMVFSLADLLAGWFLVRLLRARNLNTLYAALWLWNPMVATISTRGSSEGLLGALTAALLWAVERRRFDLAAGLLGLSVHFKIYPLIYAPAILWWMDDERLGAARGFMSLERVRFALLSLAVFMSLNVGMYLIYGMPFVEHSYLHHVTRIDHRHNFSPYNVLLYLTSANSSTSLYAFIPQLLLSCLLIPLVLAKKDLATSMLAQTFAFVTFNKVCTSQYFLWYLIFLPLYLPSSSLLRPRLGMTALLLWVLGQASWLHQAYALEFLGKSTFFPGMWISSLAFFLINCWILGVVISDAVSVGPGPQALRKEHVE